MDIEKAVEIVESLGVIDVTYNGKSVWIESISSQSNVATVKDLKTEEEFIVNIDDLKEE